MMLQSKEEKLQYLLELIRNDDLKAFHEYFSLYQPGIFHFLYRFTSDYETAKDLTQETFIRFWQNHHRLNCDVCSNAYLYKIARNLAINNFNKLRIVSRFPEEENMLVKYSNNPHTEYDALFFKDACQAAIEKLPARCRETFILSRYSGFEYSEIADILGVSLQTVKNQMNKALSVLKKLLSVYLN